MFVGENVSSRFVVPTVAGAVDLVVHLDMLADGHRRVREIVGLTGRVEDDVSELCDLFSLHGAHLARGHGPPPLPDRLLRRGPDHISLPGQAAAARATE